MLAKVPLTVLSFERRFGKPTPDAQAVLPEAHESLISPETVADVTLTGLSVRKPDRGIPLESTTASLSFQPVGRP
jgi:hypothetical protein